MNEQTASKVPQIRFKGFSGEWMERKIHYLADRYDNLRIPISASKRIPGPTPYYGANGIQDYVQGYTHDGEFILVAEDGANDLKNYPVQYVSGEVWVNNHAHVLQGREGFAETLFLKFAFSQVNIEKFLVGGGRSKLNAETMMHMELCAPSDLTEQTKIGGYFRELDRLIGLHQRKHDKLMTLKKAMLQKMFPQPGATIPEIRFKDFSGDWVEKKLGEVMAVGSVKRIHQSDWTKAGVRFLRARDIVSAYKNEDPADVLYISQAKYDEYSVLSGKVELGDLLVTGVGTIGIPYLIRKNDPIYFKDGNIIWFKNHGTLNGDFLYYSFIGERIQNYIKESAGTGTVGTYTISSGKDTPLTSPLSDEQQKIGSYFRTLDEMISKHATQLQKLKQIKSACLEKMFV